MLHLALKEQGERERERGITHIQPTRLIQVLPGHSLADLRSRNRMHQYKGKGT